MSTLYQENILLGKILNISIILDPPKADPNAHIKSPTYPILQEIAIQIQEEKLKSIREKPTLLDAIITHKLKGNSCPLRFFIISYSCIQNEKEKAYNAGENIQLFLEFLNDVFVNYARLATFSIPEMLGYEEYKHGDNSEEYIAQQFVLLFEEFEYPRDFISALMGTADQSESAEINLFKGIVGQVLKTIREKDISKRPKNLLFAFSEIVNYSEKVKELIFDVPQIGWLPGYGGIELKGGLGGTRGDLLESDSLLGILFKHGYLPAARNILKPSDNQREIIYRIYKELSKKQSRGVTLQILRNHHTNILTHTQILLDIIKSLIRSKNPAIKEETIRWLIGSSIGNEQRAKLGHHLEESKSSLCSSDNFCLNLTLVLLQLANPFLSLEKPDMLNKIDPSYVLAGRIEDFRFQTPINTVISEEERKDGAGGKREFGTISEFYWGLIYAIHTCFLPTIKHHETVINALNKLREAKSQMNSMHPEWQKVEEEEENILGINSVYNMSLFMTDLIKWINNLFNVNFSLLLKWANYDHLKNSLPDIYSPLNYIPDYYITQMADYFLYLIQFNPHNEQLISDPLIIQIILFTTVMMDNGNKISNPYTKAKFIEVIGQMAIVYKKQNLLDLFMRNQIVKDRFMNLLIEFYAEIEFTGSSNQFYDKFTYRHWCMAIFDRLLKASYMRHTIQTDTPSFQKFITRLMNDVTYCIEEAFPKLQDMQRYESEGHRSREEIGTYHQNEGNFRFLYRQLTESYQLLSNLTRYFPPIFSVEPFVGRIAVLLNLTQTYLVGPFRLDVKVKNAEQLNYTPAKLLKLVIICYFNLCEIPEFLMEVVKDERSFNIEYIVKASRIVQLAGGFSSLECQQYTVIHKRLLKVLNTQTDNEEDFDNIPNDFLCPVTYDIMKDPVKLPTSGQTCDRATMKRLLLDKEEDPFNRKALKYEDLIGDNELKDRIEKWIEDKRNGVETDEDKREKEMNKSVEEEEEVIDEVEEEKMLQLAMAMSLSDWKKE